MRELSINEVDAVSGGYLWLVRAIIGGVITEVMFRSYDAAVDYAADLPTGPGSGHTGIGACESGCHGG